MWWFVGLALAADADGDGIADKADACPSYAEDVDGFQDEDGCPDPDNDADGILDVADLCVDEPEDVDGFEDSDGCPDGAVPGPPVAPPNAAPTGPLRIVAIDGDSDSGCVVVSDGGVACWGRAGDGRPEGRFSAIAVHGMYACGGDADGRWRCWGHDEPFLPAVPEAVQALVAGSPLRALEVSADGVACGLDGTTVRCSERFDGAPAGAHQQVRVDRDRACALTVDGKASCWPTSHGAAPEAPPAERFVAITPSCGLREDGTASCWRGGAPPALTFTRIAESDGTVCGVTTDAALACWGRRATAAPTKRRVAEVGMALGGHGCWIEPGGAAAGCWPGVPSQGQFSDGAAMSSLFVEAGLLYANLRLPGDETAQIPLATSVR